MTSLGRSIRQRRRELGYRSLEDLAEAVSRLQGAPEVTAEDIGYIERARITFRIDDPDECLPWVLKALRMEDGKAVLRALGLAA